MFVVLCVCVWIYTYHMSNIWVFLMIRVCLASQLAVLHGKNFNVEQWMKFNMALKQSVLLNVLILPLSEI